MATLGELEAEFRKRAFDQIGPAGKQEWASQDIWNYLMEAQNQWCRRTNGLYDTTSSFLHFSTAGGASSWTLDNRILTIRFVKPDNSRQLQLVSIEELALYYPNWTAAAPDTPRFYLTDRDLTKLSVWPTPVATDTIRVSASRLPLDFTLNPTLTAGYTMEILPVYHLDLLDWVQFRAYDWMQKQSETPGMLWKEKSMEAYARFERNFGSLPGDDAESARQNDYPRDAHYGQRGPFQRDQRPAER